ncbi:hypothetical protein DZF91_11400 [Actinomadura logoneensis]|uniref:histidine kinase n=2 Tax=Actinomadura logoneensis TaxID=2293572 RepID=A0A372JP49_9ACTN|nr:hypothetical protein DZF91_11400 [Actinomadura logoneensis]
MRERARIARELHDVVAHSVSMIAVQAETAPYTMENLSPEAREGYTEIARTAREALVEMRRLLGVLRADAGAGAESAPQPRLDRLPELVEQHQGAGGRADLVVQGQPRALSTTVELSAYRIVQEALTNARRHAPGADVHIELTYLPDRLAVRVRDEGAEGRTQVLDPREAAGRTTVLEPGNGAPNTGYGPSGTAQVPAGPGYGPSGTAQVPAGFGYGPAGADGAGNGPSGAANGQPGGGHGILGMRERATMLGGRFSAGHAAGGGFVVEAELPLTREDPAGDPGTSR